MVDSTPAPVLVLRRAASDPGQRRVFQLVGPGPEILGPDAPAFTLPASSGAVGSLRLYHDAGAWWVEPVQGSPSPPAGNPAVNDRPIGQRAPLVKGDVLTVGNAKLQVLRARTGQSNRPLPRTAGPLRLVFSHPAPAAFDHGRVVSVTTDQSLMLGRDHGAIPLLDSRVSRRHAVLERRGEHWWLRDLASRNGLWTPDGAVPEAPLRTDVPLTIGRLHVRRLEEAALPALDDSGQIDASDSTVMDTEDVTPSGDCVNPSPPEPAPASPTVPIDAFAKPSNSAPPVRKGPPPPAPAAPPVPSPASRPAPVAAAPPAVAPAPPPLRSTDRTSHALVMRAFAIEPGTVPRQPSLRSRVSRGVHWLVLGAPAAPLPPPSSDRLAPRLAEIFKTAGKPRPNPSLEPRSN